MDRTNLAPSIANRSFRHSKNSWEMLSTGNTVVFYFLQKQESKKKKVAVSTVSESQQEPGYASDAELLAAAGNIMLR